jgi:hypothetical protein
MTVKKRVICLSIVTILSLSIIIPIAVNVSKIYGEVVKLEETYYALRESAQTDLLELVVSQSEYRAREFENTVNEYQHVYNPNWFKMAGTGYVCHSIDRNEDVIFYPETMELLGTYNNFYDLVDKSTGAVLARRVSPEWNRSVLNDFLNIAVRNTRLFGPEGDPIIIDQRTKEILIDDSFNCSDVPEVMGADGRRYMTLDWKHPNNMNPEASKWVIDNVLTWNNDQLWIYFFTAPYITVEDLETGKAFDMEENPLQISSDIGREIGYTVVVEIKNQYGMVLPLRIMFGAQEYEFTQSFDDTVTEWELLTEILAKNKIRIILLPTITLLVVVVLCLIIILLLTNMMHIFPQNQLLLGEDELREFFSKNLK